MANRKSFFITLVTLSIILSYLASEIYLPAMPQLQSQLGCTVSDLQITLSIFVFGVAIAQLIGGPIIDRFNYRKIAIIMCVIFTLSSISCALSNTLISLIFSRLIQAISAGFLANIGRASLIRTFEPQETMRIYLFISPVLALSLSFSPFIGGYLTYLLGWQSVFYFTAILGLVLLLLIIRFLFIEKKPSISIHPLTIAKTYLSLLQNSSYLAAVLVVCACFGETFAYLSESPFIFSHLNYSSENIGKFYILYSLAFVLGSWAVRRFREKFEYASLIYFGFSIVLVGMAVLFFISLIPIRYAYEIITASMLYGFGNGILIPLASGKALSFYPEKAGYAAGLLGSLSLFSSAIAANLVNHLTLASTNRLAIFMGFIAVIGLLSFYLLEKRATFQRLINDEIS